MIEEVPEQIPSSYIVRYGIMRLLGDFESRRAMNLQRGDEVIVRSDRGVEWGTVLCPATDRTAEYLGATRSGGGRIIRTATDDDRRSRSESIEREKSFFNRAVELITERQMQMQLIDIEHVFGGERVILYYLSEKRVDFRDLVKLMARDFNARIEMRQIGIRDEAKLLADYGDCGKPLCCNTHLQEMPPVSMKMAKLQKATLDPNKISGRCGRLKCCLRYEYDTYEAHRRELPAIGSVVVTKNGTGRVLSQELLARMLVVSYEDGRRVMTTEAEIVTVISRGAKNRPKSRDDDGNNPEEGLHSDDDSL
ncbi:MAG: stage 0 sporulation family protein [Planctomyces sp.]|jgi:cell fate regulator YaaT (PSP1 superfamily)